jgi:hypothetical protein
MEIHGFVWFTELQKIHFAMDMNFSLYRIYLKWMCADSNAQHGFAYLDMRNFRGVQIFLTLMMAVTRQ